MKLWPHQQAAIAGLSAAMNAGERSILLQSPTGGGKTAIMFELVRWGFPVVFYLHRRALLDQFADRLAQAGIPYGIRAAGEDPRLIEGVQLAMLQTDHARCIASRTWKLHEARIVFVDEAHDQKAGQAQDIFAAYEKTDAVRIGATATPVDLAGLYSVLINAGNITELRHCGALLPAVTYAPNEPDVVKLSPNAAGRYSQTDIDLACAKIITGNIYDHWRRLNPDARPSIGFACSVPASLGHAQQFQKLGVRAAHIDGRDTWIDGDWYETNSDTRRQLEDDVKSGRIAVVWNRFVLREGIDWPFIGHGIFATIFGSLVSYIQAGGRVLRNHPDLDRVTIQDHGGNWHRFGSLNTDRRWTLGDTVRILTAMRAKRLREKTDPEPITCPVCFAVRTWGRACDECGHQTRRRARFLQQSDGRLREVSGDIYTARRRTSQPAAAKAWEKVYWRSRRAGMTFAQAEALFARENDWRYPSRDFPGMPTTDLDFFRKVEAVHPNRLTALFPRQKDETECLI